MPFIVMGDRAEDLSVWLYQGTDWQCELLVTDAAGAAVNMTGINARLTLQATTPIVLTAVGGTSGIYTFALTDTQVDALPSTGRALLDLVSGADTLAWARGSFTVSL